MKKPFSHEEEPPEPPHVPTVPPPPGATLSKEVKASLAEMRSEVTKDEKKDPFTASQFEKTFTLPAFYHCAHKTFSELREAYRHSPSDQAQSVADYLNDMNAQGKRAFACWADSTNLYVLFLNE